MNYRIPAGSSPHAGMNRFAELQTKDQLVPDERYFFRPSEVVQQKLQRVLPGSHTPVSSLHLARLVRR